MSHINIRHNFDRNHVHLFWCTYVYYHILDVPTKRIFPRQSLLSYKIWLQLIKNNCLNGLSNTNTKNQLPINKTIKSAKCFQKWLNICFSQTEIFYGIQIEIYLVEN